MNPRDQFSFSDLEQWLDINRVTEIECLVRPSLGLARPATAQYGPQPGYRPSAPRTTPHDSAPYGYGRGYNDPAYLAQRHGAGDCPVVENLRKLLSTLAEKAVATP